MGQRWYCVGEDVESTQELSGTPEDNDIDPKFCVLAFDAEEAFEKWTSGREG